MLIFGIVAALVIVGFAIRILLMRDNEDVLRGPHLHARLDVIFEPHAGQRLSPDAVLALQARADTEFRDIMTGVGLVPDPWCVRVHLDDVLGPVPRVHGPAGQVLHVGEFEQRVLDGRIELTAG